MSSEEPVQVTTAEPPEAARWRSCGRVGGEASGGACGAALAGGAGGGAGGTPRCTKRERRRRGSRPAARLPQQWARWLRSPRTSDYLWARLPRRPRWWERILGPTPFATLMEVNEPWATVGPRGDPRAAPEGPRGSTRLLGEEAVEAPTHRPPEPSPHRRLDARHPGRQGPQRAVALAEQPPRVVGPLVFRTHRRKGVHHALPRPEGLHVHEAGPPDGLPVGVERVGVLASGELVDGVLAQEGLELPVVVGHVLAGGEEQAPRLQDPRALAQRRLEVAGVVEDLPRVDHSEAATGERQRLGEPGHHLDRQAGAGPAQAALADHVARVRLQRHHARGAGGGQGEAGDAGPGPEVEHRPALEAPREQPPDLAELAGGEEAPAGAGHVAVQVGVAKQAGPARIGA